MRLKINNLIFMGTLTVAMASCMATRSFRLIDNGDPKITKSERKTDIGSESTITDLSKVPKPETPVQESKTEEVLITVNEPIPVESNRAMETPLNRQDHLVIDQSSVSDQQIKVVKDEPKEEKAEEEKQKPPIIFFLIRILVIIVVVLFLIFLISILLRALR